jgi:hypothetical protein
MAAHPKADVKLTPASDRPSSDADGRMTIAQLEAALAKLESALESARRELDASREQTQAVQAELGVSREEARLLRFSVSQSEAGLRATLRRVATLRKVLADRRADVASLDAKLRIATRELALATARGDALSAQLEASRAAAADRDVELDYRDRVATELMAWGEHAERRAEHAERLLDMTWSRLGHRLDAWWHGLRHRGSTDARDLIRALPKPTYVPSEVSPPWAWALTDHPQLAAYIRSTEPDAARLKQLVTTSADFTYRPTISVIVPIYRVPTDVLEDTLACLEQQVYPEWQGCLVWSDTGDADGWRWLQERIAAEPRFRAVRLERNGGISRNSNAALELATGEFIALLDHDDILAPWAFHDVVATLQSRPDLDFIYSDKDWINADGSLRCNALLKPEWSPEMLHSANYLTHLNIMRTALVREIGGWDPETDGAQDWDIFFRITERTSRIARIPSIHYHWRILSTSTATGLQAKPWAAIGQLRAQQNHFRRLGLDATVVPTEHGLFRVEWPTPAGSCDVVAYQSGSAGEMLQLLNFLRATMGDEVGRVTALLAEAPEAALQAIEGVWGERLAWVVDPVPTWRAALEAAMHRSDATTTSVLLLDGRVSSITQGLAAELAGWAGGHPQIAWAGATLMLDHDTVREAGRVVAPDGASAPLFRDAPMHVSGWFGSPLWYRNARAVSPSAVAIKAALLRDALDATEGNDREAFVRFCMGLLQGERRGLVTPHAQAWAADTDPEGVRNDGDDFAADPYFHPSFARVNPLALRA